MEIYGKLRVIDTFKKKRNTRGYRLMANCVCECGNKSTVQVENLRSGHTQSCGCHMISRITKHGLSGHQLYGIWEGIVGRCYNPNAKHYNSYGGRGIVMITQWRENAGDFIKWCLANGWSPGLSIERNDVNGNYEPSNCSFIPMVMQAKNTRKSFKIDINGHVDTQRGWAKIIGINVSTMRHRLKGGMTMQEIYNTGVTITPEPGTTTTTEVTTEN